MSTPSWTDTAIWYAIYPLGMVGAPQLLSSADSPEQPCHRLRRIEAWLDHLVSLGCNALLLGPIFTSASHGYDTLDYFTIDPRLGDEDDLLSLVEECHSRGIHILLDGVFNHVSQDFEPLQQALATSSSRYADWFHIDYSATPPIRLNFEGSDDLVLLNHRSQGVHKLITDVMRYWLERGIDGWRLDAAYAVSAEFWSEVLPSLQKEFPQALFTGEVIHADLDWVKRSTLASITGYELWKATWSSLKDANFFELDWTLTRNNELLDVLRPLTFLGNHDVTRIATTLDPQSVVLAMTILCTSGGMPSVYYGDEGGTPGTKYERAGGDEEIRSELPAQPSAWKPAVPWLLDQYRALIALRRRHPWLVNARYEKLKLSNKRICYRVHADDQWLRVELDLTHGQRAVVSGPDGECFRYTSP